ncbi:MAG: c-type cytochrome [Methylotenera sp.]|nr:c-type cytochrome [Methylotenera sp.]
MQFHHLMQLNSASVNLTGLMLGVLFSVSAQAAADQPVASADKTLQTVNTVCAACHGTDGNSAITLNPKLAGQHPEYLVKQLAEFKSGKRVNAVMSGMAAMLSDDEMKNVAAYFSAQSLKLGQAKTNGKGSLGEKIYRGGVAATNIPACAACHGATGAGIPKQFPRLAGQHTDYTLTQMRSFRTGERANAPMMMAIATKMTDAEMAAVADYIQGLR